MHVAAYNPGHGPALYALYLQSTQHLAHCQFVPSARRFASDLVEGAARGTELFIAKESDRLQAFAALTPLSADEDIPERTAITALLATDENSGAAVLEACLERARANGRSIRAFPDAHNFCPVPSYNAGWCGLSDRQPIVARLLASSGFTPYYRELHLSLSDCRRAGPPGVPPDGITLQIREPRDGRWERRWRALRGSEEAGICVTSTVAHLTDHPAAARWGYVQGLWVDKVYRRQGIARWLMRTALSAMADEGCQGCWLTTGATNWGAQRLYLSLGFEVDDASTSFRVEPSVHAQPGG
ncbi:MAG TPA: GNAT family N-acetyltransferase [Chloroflexota bacterium]|nr:GNAT family N-acetyltransferase [Chloroflexota bacterium]